MYACNHTCVYVCATCRLGLQLTIVWIYSYSFANIIVFLVPEVRCPKPQTGASARAFTHSLSHWSFFPHMFYLWASKLLVLVTALGPFYFIPFSPAHSHMQGTHLWLYGASSSLSSAWREEVLVWFSILIVLLLVSWLVAMEPMELVSLLFGKLAARPVRWCLLYMRVAVSSGSCTFAYLVSTLVVLAACTLGLCLFICFIDFFLSSFLFITFYVLIL